MSIKPEHFTIEMEPFSVCPNCKHTWPNRDDFLSDNGVEPIGYQVHFERLTAGLFLFNHSCNGTFAVEVSGFEDLYDGPVFAGRETGTTNCPGHCLHEEQLEPCPAECECAFVREIIQILKR